MTNKQEGTTCYCVQQSHFGFYGVCGDSSADWMLRGGKQSADCSHNHKWRGSWPAANHLWARLQSSTASTRRARLPNILIFRLKRDTLSATVLAHAISRINREISFNLEKKNVDILCGLLSLEMQLRLKKKKKPSENSSWFHFIAANDERRWRNTGLCDTEWHCERCEHCHPCRTAAVVSHLQNETVNGWTFLLNQSAKLRHSGNCICNNTKCVVCSAAPCFCIINKDIFQR